MGQHIKKIFLFPAESCFFFHNFSDLLKFQLRLNQFASSFQVGLGIVTLSLSISSTSEIFSKNKLLLKLDKILL